MMLTSIEIKGEIYLGEYPVFIEGCQHQPNRDGIYIDRQYGIYENNNAEIFANSYHICPVYTLPFGSLDSTGRADPSEYTSYYIYVLSDAYYYGQQIYFDRYYGTLDKYVYTQGNSPQLPQTTLNISANGNIAIYHYLEVITYVSKYKYYESGTVGVNRQYPPKPTYKDLVSGYYLDNRILPDELKIVPTKTTTIELSYYRNTGNPQPFTAIEWMVYKCDLVKSKLYTLPIVEPTLGTLYVSDDEIKTLIGQAIKAGKYLYKYLFNNNLLELFNYWNTLQQAELNKPLLPPAHNFTTITKLTETYQNEISRQLRCLGGNNDVWHNRPNPTVDINPDLTHPLWVVDDDRAYKWWFEPQIDGSFGTIIMHNPKLDEIHKAIDAAKYAIDPSTNDARVANLGWHINRQSELLGCRVKPDGTIDEALEKTTNRRLHVEGSADNDTQKYNPNCFGSEGMLVRHLPNKFSTSGTAAGGYRKVKDIPQLLAELHEQANAAMGYQEGTAIEIQLDGQTYRYPNQLALLTELFVTAKQTATYSKGAFFSSVVGEQSIKEVMAGLGLRTVDKFLEFKVASKTAKLYYKGISASQSIRRKLSAVTTNIGIAIGNII
jgi:hypothetical protein